MNVNFRGIGYATARELCSKLKSADIYLTTRGETTELNNLIKHEVGDKADMVNFHSVEVTDQDSVVQFRNSIYERHGRLDILINNAGQYFLPSPDPAEHSSQVERTLRTNYWGTKTVCQVEKKLKFDRSTFTLLRSARPSFQCYPQRRG